MKSAAPSDCFQHRLSAAQFLPAQELTELLSVLPLMAVGGPSRPGLRYVLLCAACDQIVDSMSHLTSCVLNRMVPLKVQNPLVADTDRSVLKRPLETLEQHDKHAKRPKSPVAEFRDSADEGTDDHDQMSMLLAPVDEREVAECEDLSEDGELSSEWPSNGIFVAEAALWLGRLTRRRELHPQMRLRVSLCESESSLCPETLPPHCSPPSPLPRLSPPSALTSVFCGASVPPVRVPSTTGLSVLSWGSAVPSSAALLLRCCPCFGDVMLPSHCLWLLLSPFATLAHLSGALLREWGRCGLRSSPPYELQRIADTPRPGRDATALGAATASLGELVHVEGVAPQRLVGHAAASVLRRRALRRAGHLLATASAGAASAGAPRPPPAPARWAAADRSASVAEYLARLPPRPSQAVLRLSSPAFCFRTPDGIAPAPLSIVVLAEAGTPHQTRWLSRDDPCRVVLQMLPKMACAAGCKRPASWLVSEHGALTLRTSPGPRCRQCILKEAGASATRLVADFLGVRGEELRQWAASSLKEAEELAATGEIEPNEILRLEADGMDDQQGLALGELWPEYRQSAHVVLEGVRAALRWKDQLRTSYSAPLSPHPDRLPHWTSKLDLGQLRVASPLAAPPFELPMRSEYELGDDVEFSH